MPVRKKPTLVDTMEPELNSEGPWWCASCKSLAISFRGRWFCPKGCDVGFVRITYNPPKKAAD